MSIIVTQINRSIMNALANSIEKCYDDIRFQKEYYIKYSNTHIYIYKYTAMKIIYCILYMINCFKNKNKNVINQMVAFIHNIHHTS